MSFRWEVGLVVALDTHIYHQWLYCLRELVLQLSIWNFKRNLWLGKFPRHRTWFDVDISRLFGVRFIISKGKPTGWTPGRILSFLTPSFDRQLLLLVGVVAWAKHMSRACLLYCPFGNVCLSNRRSSRQMPSSWPSWEWPDPRSWSPSLLRFNDLLIFGENVLHRELHRGTAQALTLRPHCTLNFGLAWCLLSVFQRRFLSVLLQVTLAALRLR